ncbi:hypothetical protein QY97_00939 [Bacillus thermotolerans]|uniref:VanZ-like domain-containing protein n=2 Tax=Bacillus thermotolerans TaxID=1221996 RepID=A0A0F5HU53_BACTR|nr:hypothetical protein QY97_00939 [Bacillus thermotolerans]KKB40993.1 hypothetical protein QY95_01056 [Bacillus thermotolerans]KKB44941.1 hypothetical protein QY96_00065 [Bacillus thermotolerans]
MPDNAVIELPERSIDRFFKESLHLIEFAILYILIINAFLVNGRLTKGAHLTAALIACFYGFVDEIHQAFVPSRSATAIDAVKDVIGVLVCYYIVQASYFTHPRRRVGQWMEHFATWIRP